MPNILQLMLSYGINVMLVANSYKQLVKISKVEAVLSLPKLGKVEKVVCGACQIGKHIRSQHPKLLMCLPLILWSSCILRLLGLLE